MLVANAIPVLLGILKASVLLHWLQLPWVLQWGPLLASPQKETKKAAWKAAKKARLAKRMAKGKKPSAPRHP